MQFLFAILAAALAFCSCAIKEETTPPAPVNPKRKKYSKAFILASGKWLKENKVPEDWDGSKLEYAVEEMPFEGEVYE